MDSAEYERKIAPASPPSTRTATATSTAPDFNAAAARLLTEFGTTARCDKGQALYIGAEAFWQGMAGIADVDGDQRVTREEFVGGAVKRLRDNPERFAEIARPFLHAAIAVADSEDDGGRASVGRRGAGAEGARGQRRDRGHRGPEPGHRPGRADRRGGGRVRVRRATSR